MTKRPAFGKNVPLQAAPFCRTPTRPRQLLRYRTGLPQELRFWGNRFLAKYRDKFLGSWLFFLLMPTRRNQPWCFPHIKDDQNRRFLRAKLHSAVSF